LVGLALCSVKKYKKAKDCTEINEKSEKAKSKVFLRRIDGKREERMEK